MTMKNGTIVMADGKVKIKNGKTMIMKNGLTIPGKLTTPFRGKLTRHLPGERVQRVL